MGGGPILSHFSPIFGFRKFLQVFDISRGEKTLFFKKCPNSGLVSEKKYFFRYSRRNCLLLLECTCSLELKMIWLYKVSIMISYIKQSCNLVVWHLLRQWVKDDLGNNTWPLFSYWWWRCVYPLPRRPSPEVREAAEVFVRVTAEYNFVTV